MALLVAMSSLEHWQETDAHGPQPAPVMVPATLPMERGDTS
jgi:hypothetical protein